MLSFQSFRGALPLKAAKAEIIPAEPDQGNACAGRFLNLFIPLHSISLSFSKFIKMKRIAFFIFFSNSLITWGQTNDTTELLPVEVKAVRASTTAPFAKTNLGKSQIQRQNLGQDLPFLLNQTPSVVVNSDAGNGVGYSGIRIRGTDATRINVTLNGIPYNDAESQGTFFVDLPDFASSVNSIQIQRGVGTSTNGSGSFGATVNVSTNEINKKPFAELNNSYGSFNTWKNTIKAGTGLLGNHFITDVRLSRISSDGYIDRATTDLKSFYFSTAYVAAKTSFRLNIFSGKEKTYQAWNGVTETDLQMNRRVNYAGTAKPGAPYENETDNYNQDHYQFFYTQRFSERLVLTNAVFLVKGKGYYEQYKADEKYSKYGISNRIIGANTLTRSDFIRQLWLDNDYYGDVFSLQYEKAKTQLNFGGSILKYKGNHFGEVIWAKNGLDEPKHRWYDLDAVKNDASLYAKWQQDINSSLQFFADAQYRKVKYDIGGFRDNPTLFVNNHYSFFNPKIGLTYRKNNWMSYASYSIANKEPNREDFEANQNQQPKPERLNDLEIGIENRNSKTSWSANFYYMRYKDQLVLTGKINDVGAYTRTNISNSYRLGIELQGSLVANEWLRASANLALSKNKIKNFTEYLDDYDNGGQKSNQYNETNIALSPAIVGSATITFIPIKQLNIDLLSKYVGDQFLDNTSNDSRKLNNYFTEDARVIYSFNRGWAKNASIIFQLNNAFSKKYEPNGYTFSYYYNSQLTTENYYFPMAERNFMAGINLKF